MKSFAVHKIGRKKKNVKKNCGKNCGTSMTETKMKQKKSEKCQKIVGKNRKNKMKKICDNFDGIFSKKISKNYRNIKKNCKIIYLIMTSDPGNAMVR